jgi:hypothetical protein
MSKAAPKKTVSSGTSYEVSSRVQIWRMVFGNLGKSAGAWYSTTGDSIRVEIAPNDGCLIAGTMGMHFERA